ncbi:MAG: LEA type 2 family protein [Candidatus Kapabacteria bacterium]|nr:LEA type 2 family protein [Candidatus Kapabacteria bacterium]
MRIILILCVVFVASCASIRDITNSLASLQNMQFKLTGITGMKLAGVDIGRLANPSSLSIADGISLGQAFSRKSLPTSFTLNVDAKNPNSGTQGAKSVPLTLDDLQWRLLIDDKPTINGGLGSPVDVPGNGKTTQIPLVMDMDMYKFFADKGYDGILNLALALGGQKGSTARVKLDAMPTVGTPLGPMTYPNRIAIVDTEFRGK